MTEYDLVAQAIRRVGAVMHAPAESDAEKVARVLRELPRDPDEIAAFLHGQGITGERGCPESCVLANFFRVAYGLRVSVSPSYWSQIVPIAFPGTDPYKNQNMPRHVAAFLYRFDRGEYPELEEGEGAA